MDDELGGWNFWQGVSKVESAVKLVVEPVVDLTALRSGASQ